MADSKISALSALTGANVEQLADVLPIVDTSVTTTKKILVSELSQAMLVLGTAQATTSGTEKDFPIPAWAKKVTLQLVGVSTNGTSSLIVQLGDSGGIEINGYLSAVSNVGNAVATVASTLTSGFIVQGAMEATAVLHGTVTLTLENSAAFTWVAVGVLSRSDAANLATSSGSKSTSATMTTVRITTANGTDAFDAGAVNVLYE